MAIEDGLCLAELVDAAQGDFDRAFRQFAAARHLRTARVTLESRYLWDVYHAEGIARDVYRQTLGDRPWRRCPCAICRKAGIHVVLFRGAERNRRRIRSISAGMTS